MKRIVPFLHDSLSLLGITSLPTPTPNWKAAILTSPDWPDDLVVPQTEPLPDDSECTQNSIWEAAPGGANTPRLQHSVARQRPPQRGMNSTTFLTKKALIVRKFYTSTLFPDRGRVGTTMGRLLGRGVHGSLQP